MIANNRINLMILLSQLADTDEWGDARPSVTIDELPQGSEGRPS